MLKFATAAVLFSFMGGSAFANGVCPTTEIVGHYVVTSASCSDGGNPDQRLGLTGFLVQIPDKDHNPMSVDAEIVFVGAGMGWGILRNSQGGQSEECVNTNSIKKIRRSNFQEEMQFSQSGASFSKIYMNGSVCAWSLTKQ